MRSVSGKEMFSASGEIWDTKINQDTPGKTMNIVHVRCTSAVLPSSVRGGTNRQHGTGNS